jgi:hypothetical protein
MSVREPIGTLARGAVGNFRTNSDMKTALFLRNSYKPSTLHQSVSALITAAFRTDGALPRREMREVGSNPGWGRFPS